MMEHGTSVSFERAAGSQLTLMGAQAGWASDRPVPQQVRQAVLAALAAAQQKRAALAGQALCSEVSNSGSFSRIHAVS
ncbi:MAG: hypothetical protein KDC46_10490 [Thermoleophilia bacterium]|nr:hypothetical protein [Thermoleophilia bacterium]